MEMVLLLINKLFVTFYGTAIAMDILDVGFKKNWKKEAVFSFFVFLLMIGTNAVGGNDLMLKIYPLVVHLPIVLFLVFGQKKTWLKAVTAVAIGYLMCQPRQWIGRVIRVAFAQGAAVEYGVNILVTIPLVLFLVHYVTPYFAYVMKEGKKMILLMGALPYFFYIECYVASVYQNKMFSGTMGQVVEGIMPAVFSAIYLLFMIVQVKENNDKLESERRNRYLEAENQQAKSQLEWMQQMEDKQKVYRHDMRHHLVILKEYINSAKYVEALQYIQETDVEIQGLRTKLYCQNLTVNLLLSHFADAAEQSDIDMEITAHVSGKNYLKDTDLCVLLSNALENAIHACQKWKVENPQGKPQIDVVVEDKDGKLKIQVINSCQKEVKFVDETPVRTEEGQGMGVKSICNIAEKYKGVCDFSHEGDRFSLRFLMPIAC